jgi:coenzyme F420 hydrogenase subunit delta
MANYWAKQTLVLGCGNVLFGDDGFGPAVTEHLQKNFEIPQNISVINAGLSVRNILFDIMLSENRPKRIIIVDAVDMNRLPGETFELNVSEIPEKKIDDFSMHQLPTSNLLRELKNLCDVDVKILSIQPKNIPEEVSPGLSEIIRDSIPAVCEKILSMISVPVPNVSELYTESKNVK